MRVKMSKKENEKKNQESRRQIKLFQISQKIDENSDRQISQQCHREKVAKRIVNFCSLNLINCFICRRNKAQKKYIF